jgi:acetylornithine/succinyldiaminopimelate/putrescine aminotransferase
MQHRELFFRHLGQTSPEPLAFEVDRAQGVWLYGPDAAGTPSGRKVLDLIAGIAVSGLGHGHPKVLEAIRTQSERYLHTMVYGELIQAPQVRLAEKLCSLLPDPLDSVFWVNSGSEAVEAALKLAKRATGRTGLAGFHRSYHGATHGALSLGGTEAWKSAFRPLLPDVHTLPYGEDAAMDLLCTDMAAVLVEPIQGEAGVRRPPEGWLARLRERCDALGILLIFDESQTGCGRTGTWFAQAHSGVVPDILVTAKAIGGGLPLGGFVASTELMRNLTHRPVLGHISTFGGHPLSCAAGLAALNALEKEALLERVQPLEARFREGLQDAHGVQEIRSCGLMMAVQQEGGFPRNKAVIDRALRAGLMTDWFLYCDDALRIAPPLILSDEEADWAIEVLRDAMAAEQVG